MIQNVLIGVTAFAVAVYWCAKVDCAAGSRVSWWEIWIASLNSLSASLPLDIFSVIDQSVGKDMSSVISTTCCSGLHRTRASGSSLAFTARGF
jgi:hypothetical protein